MENFYWPVIGHDKIVKYLQKSIVSKKLAHAYLFTGQDNLGKKLLADNFLSSILCYDNHLKIKTQPEKFPCQICVYCDQLKKGIHPDVYFLNKEEDTNGTSKKNITVEQVRKMQKVLQMGSFLKSYKIALISDAQDLNESAQNALLKILEEPAKKTILILIAQDSSLLLPTIVSRCQQVVFKPVNNQKIFDHLISLGANRDQANELSALAHGQIGLAVNYYNQPESLSLYKEKIKSFYQLAENSSLSQRFKKIDHLLAGLKTNQEINNFLFKELNNWQILFRDLLVLKNNNQDLIINYYFKDQLINLANKYSEAQLINLIKKVSQIKKYLSYNINPRLAVESLILNF